jgi:hypothetical protein
MSERQIHRLTTQTPKQNVVIKKLTCKGTLRQVLSEFIGWRYIQSCWYTTEPGGGKVYTIMESYVGLFPLLVDIAFLQIHTHMTIKLQ